MFELKVTAHFAAAHRLTMVGQKCENLHGHNWKVEARVTGETLDDAGVLVDFGVLKKELRDIVGSLDHRFLNELSVFQAGGQPTSERIAEHIATSLQERLAASGVRVSSVTAWESENAAATFIPPAP